MDNKTFRRTLGERLGRSVKDIDALLGALCVLIVENSQTLRALAIPGFGSFVPVKHDEQIVNDLAGGKRLLLPPEIVLEYVPGSAMRRSVDPSAPVPADAPDPAGGVMTLHTAAEALAGINEIGTDAAERFLRECFLLIEDEDARSGQVDVKGLGLFCGLSFRPDSALALEINQPFAMFEPVELEDSIDESSFIPSGEKSAEIPEEEPADASGESLLPPASEPTVDDAEEIQETRPACDLSADTEQEPPEPTPLRQEPQTPPSPQPYEEPWPEEPSRSRKVWLSVAAIIALLFAFGAGFISGRYSVEPVARETVRFDTLRITVHDTITLTPEVEKPRPQPAPDPIFDTVTPTRYLATMSRQYYGKMEYWVYIYKANEQKLGNPDKIRPGTRVEIPPFEKYAVSDNDSVNLAQARRMSEEIYARFRK